MIVRDAQAIIIQHNWQNPTAAPDSASGGDSCARTGPLARAGSIIDVDNVPLFIVGDQVVRHPTAPNYNTPDKTSRDNIVQYFVADLDCQRAAALAYAEAGWVNKDFLSPAVRLYLYRVARKTAPAWIRLLGPVDLYLSIIWASYVQPKEEVNQLACMVTVLGSYWAKLLIKHHSTLIQNIAEYWNKWRDNREVGEAILNNLSKTAHGS